MKYVSIFICTIICYLACAQDTLRVPCQDKTLADINKTIVQFKTRLLQTPGDPHLYYELGMSYFKLHKPDTAIAYFDTVIAINAYYGGVFVGRAICKFMKKDKDGACEDFKKSLIYDKDYDDIMEGKKVSEYVSSSCD